MVANLEIPSQPLCQSDPTAAGCSVPSSQTGGSGTPPPPPTGPLTKAQLEQEIASLLRSNQRLQRQLAAQNRLLRELLKQGRSAG